MLIAYDSAVRMLTEKECAIIQSFPVGHVFVGPRTHVYKQIGNAVPPKLAQCVGGASGSFAASPRQIHPIIYLIPLPSRNQQDRV